MPDSLRERAIGLLAVLLSIFTLLEVNYPRLSPQSQLAVFALLGLVLCFLIFPIDPRARGHAVAGWLDVVFSLIVVLCCAYVVLQTEPIFERFWFDGRSLGARAGAEVTADVVVGILGVLVVLEASRRTLGLALPLLAIAFLLYAYFGPSLPGWLFPHRGYPVERIVAQTFLHSQGVFGTALSVMFAYVFLFVLFGAFLEATGATQFIIDYAQHVFRRSPGGPAKVAVLSSGLMGSLSGSAVANAATTGTFTIPLMRSAGFRSHIAAGVTAAASSGGALVPPVMGAGAYMMLEIVDPPVTYLEIIKAAIVPSLLYYLSLFLIVHFYAQRVGAAGGVPAPERTAGGLRFEGVVFFAALGALVTLLLVGYTPFRAVTLALGVIVVLGLGRARTRLTPADAARCMIRAARGGVALVAAAASVGIVIGVVTLTGVGTKFPAMLIPLAEESLFLALALIMLASIVLGMGLPSAVCYLLLATLIGPVLGDLGVVPLAGHFFIFYFGMMSMVTPPVALAAYTSASIAGTRIMETALAAFRFALVGFTLPFMFVFRPQLLLLSSTGETATLGGVLVAVVVAVLGILPLAAGIAGYLLGPLSMPKRLMLFLAAGLLLHTSRVPWITIAGDVGISSFDLVGAGILGGVVAVQWARGSPGAADA